MSTTPEGTSTPHPSEYQIYYPSTEFQQLSGLDEISGAFFGFADWDAVHGLANFPARIPRVGALSIVMVSITELRFPEGGGTIPTLGAATLTVHNVTCENGLVRTRALVDWPNNIPIRLNFAVLTTD